MVKRYETSMTNKFGTHGNDYRAPEERNINSHGFQPVVHKKDRIVLAGFSTAKPKIMTKQNEDNQLVIKS